MITWGFVVSYSDLVTIDSTFQIDGLTLDASYIFVSGASGNIVWENARGLPQYLPNAQTGMLYPIGARRILSSATVNGINRTTSAGDLVFMASPSAV